MVTRRQAQDAGYRGPELRGLLSPGGAWVVVRRGVYAERVIWEALDDTGRGLMRDWAAHISTAVRHVMSHDSAGRAHGIPMLRAGLELSHLTRPGVGGSRTEHGTKHHLARLFPGLAESGVLPVTGLARTACDLAREHGFAMGVGACDHVMRRGVPRTELWAVAEEMRYWRGVTSVRNAVEFADPGAENLAESLGRILVDELGHGRPETQFAVRIEGGGVAWCDLRVGCHIFEIDGKVKLTRREDGGVADRDLTEILWDEKKRQRLVCAEGLGMSRIFWEDYFGAARDRAKARLQAEYAVTRARFGEVLPPHLARFAAEMKGRRNTA